MCVATTRLDTFLKMNAKKPACARKIDDVAINACHTRVHTRRYSAAVCIMLCTKSACAFLVCTNCTCAFWFAQAQVFNWHAVWLSMYTNNIYV